MCVKFVQRVIELQCIEVSLLLFLLFILSIYSAIFHTILHMTLKLTIRLITGTVTYLGFDVSKLK